MEALRKYGEATTINFPLIDAGANDFESTPVTFAAGDTKIKKNEGASANTTNNPAHEGEGTYSLALTATEMQAARIVITIIDSATKAWEDQCVIISTYGNASAQHAFDLDTASTAQTGDSFARLGAPAGASIAADLATIDTEVGVIDGIVDDILVDTGTTIPATLTTIDNEIGVIDGIVDSILADTADMQPKLGTPAGASISADIATIDTEVGVIDGIVDSILEDTGTTIPAALTIIDNEIGVIDGIVDAILLDTAEIANLNDLSVADIMDEADGIETGRTLRQSIRAMLAAGAGYLSGAATTTVTVKDTNNSKSRMIATVDADGNRSSITYDLS